MLPVGKNMFVRVAALEALVGRVELEDAHVGWVRCWLRYPDECEDEVVSDPGLVYVVVRNASVRSRVVGVALGDIVLALPEDETAQASI